MNDKEGVGNIIYGSRTGRSVKTGTHAHSHNKKGLLGEIEGMQNTRHFGAKHRARHKEAKNRAIRKAKGEDVGIRF